MAAPSAVTSTFPRVCLHPQNNLMIVTWLKWPGHRVFTPGKKREAKRLPQRVPTFKDLYRKCHPGLPTLCLPGLWLPLSAREAEKWSFPAAPIVIPNKIRIVL